MRLSTVGTGVAVSVGRGVGVEVSVGIGVSVRGTDVAVGVSVRMVKLSDGAEGTGDDVAAGAQAVSNKTGRKKVCRILGDMRPIIASLAEPEECDKA